MNATRSQLKTQYERAKRLGWIPHFREAVATRTKGFFDVADLMAIGSRETNLDPKWLTKAGDHGNGFGLMQADKRSFPKFTQSDAWKDARQGILFGAEVLMQKWHDVQSGIGVKRGAYSSKTKKYSYFVGKDVGQGKEAQQVTIAAYNNGRWPHYAVTNGKDPDTYTTGKDYSADVMARAKVFRELLGQVSAAAHPASNPSDPTVIRPDKEGSVELPPDFTEGERPTNGTSNVKVEITPEGGVKASTTDSSEPPAPKERIAVVKTAPKKWYAGIGAKISSVVVGNSLFQWIWARVEQFQEWQVPAWAWYTISGLVAAGSLIWIGNVIMDNRQENRRQKELDELLVKENSTADNLVQLIPHDEAELYRLRQFKIITRGEKVA